MTTDTALADFPAAPSHTFTAEDKREIALSFIVSDQIDAEQLGWCVWFALGLYIDEPSEFRRACAIHYQVLSAKAYTAARRSMGLEV